MLLCPMSLFFYATNFLSPHIKDGAISLAWSDEIIAGSLFTHEGEIRNESVRRALGL